MSGPPGPREGSVIQVRCLDRRGFVDYDRDGIPVVFRWRCRNPKCCPQTVCPPSTIKVHRQTLHGVQNGKQIGEISTTCEPTRPLAELIDLLPPENVRRVTVG